MSGYTKDLKNATLVSLRHDAIAQNPGKPPEFVDAIAMLAACAIEDDSDPDSQYVLRRPYTFIVADIACHYLNFYTKEELA